MVSSKSEGPSRSEIEFAVTDFRLPLFIIEIGTGLLVEANEAARQCFAVELKDPPESFASVLPFHKEMAALLTKLSRDHPYHFAANLFENDNNAFDAMVTILDEDGECACVVLCPNPKNKIDLRTEFESSQQLVPDPSGLVEALNKQLHFERIVRQIIAKVYNSLDKDTILQNLVDNLGRALKCQRCLVIIESPTALPVVTHEYAEADISPLGLGRTAKFPVSVFERLRDGMITAPDVTHLRNVRGVMLEDVNDLLDNSVSSMAGAPMVQRGVVYGVIVALQLGAIRKWEVQDLDLIQIGAHHAAIALEHSQSQQKVKDQLFNVNVWSNLTQQLTSTLELASRSPKQAPERQSKPSESAETPPLSSRELEVLKLIASGLANKEIANQLFLTESTVELHASRIRKKLKMRSRTALVKYACDHGIV